MQIAGKDSPAPRDMLEPDTVRQTGMRVLIVEDDKALADGLTRTLKQSGYAVDHAATGELALRACAEEHYDLIVLDLSLPGIDGFEVLRQLRRNHRAGSILILTAHDSEGDRVRGLDLGADDYVTKPFSLPELEARVRALIRRSQAVRSPKLRFGGLTVDTVARRASIGNEPLDLTPREWAVLEYLLMRIGQVVSKEHMLQAMCSWDDSLTHNAVEVYISRLRSKLQHAGIRIRTVRGFGYMVEDPDTAESGASGPAPVSGPALR
jgi:two-component system, OmpR family, response regulator